MSGLAWQTTRAPSGPSWTLLKGALNKCIPYVLTYVACRSTFLPKRERGFLSGFRAGIGPWAGRGWDLGDPRPRRLAHKPPVAEMIGRLEMSETLRCSLSSCQPATFAPAIREEPLRGGHSRLGHDSEMRVLPARHHPETHQHFDAAAYLALRRRVEDG